MQEKHSGRLRVHSSLLHPPRTHSLTTLSLSLSLSSPWSPSPSLPPSPHRRGCKGETELPHWSSLVSQGPTPLLTYSNASSSSTPSLGAGTEGRPELSPFLLASMPGGVQRSVPALMPGGGGSTAGGGGGHGGENGERNERGSVRGAGTGAPGSHVPRASPPGLARPHTGAGVVKGRGRSGEGAHGCLVGAGRGHARAGEASEETEGQQWGEGGGGTGGAAGWSAAGRGGEGNKGAGDDYKVFPRRKVGRSSRVPGERAPVVLTEDKLRECFDLPLHVASKKMGICITAIKKVPHVGVPGLGCICAHTCIHAHTYAHTCAHTKSSDLKHNGADFAAARGAFARQKIAREQNMHTPQMLIPTWGRFVRQMWHLLLHAAPQTATPQPLEPLTPKGHPTP